jgi:hypothetical protein
MFTATIDHVARALCANASAANMPNKACRIPRDRAAMSFMPQG